MELIECMRYIWNELMTSRTKRHIAIGMCLSACALFGGLALTIATLDKGEDEEDDWNDSFNGNHYRAVYGHADPAADGEAEE